MSRDLAASVRARLKQCADATKQDFNLTLTHYGLERLLYRLSVSPHAANYLLKGALLFSLWYDQPHRPTRDADLLGFGPDDVETAASAFREICQIEVEDGIAFDPAGTLPSGLSDAFVQDAAKQRQWAAFLKKNRLEALALAEVIALLRGEFQKLAAF
jgi:hypothetical protein